MMAALPPEFSLNLLFVALSLSALAVISLVALRGWRDWIQLKRDELAARHGQEAQDSAVQHTGSRIEIADLKERLRKLEAIAAGVDL